ATIYINAKKRIALFFPNKIGKVFRPLALSFAQSLILLPMLISPIVITIGILIHTAKLCKLPVWIKNAIKIMIMPIKIPENSSPKGVQEIGNGPPVYK